jgi:RIO-like serine/threonine protein kinase
MKLDKKEFDILWGINEGMKWLNELTVFSQLEESLVKDILLKLEKLKLVKLEKKIDKYYQEENWIAKLNDILRTLKVCPSGKSPSASAVSIE